MYTWQKNLPDEAGDWLWINQWGCGCCLINSGIAYVEESDIDFSETEKSREGTYFYKLGERFMVINWGKKEEWPHFYDGNPEVTGWMRIEFPHYDEDLDKPEPSEEIAGNKEVDKQNERLG